MLCPNGQGRKGRIVLSFPAQCAGGLRVNTELGFPWDTPNFTWAFGELLNRYQGRRLWLSSSPLWTLILFSVSLFVAGMIMGFGPGPGRTGHGTYLENRPPLSKGSQCCMCEFKPSEHCWKLPCHQSKGFDSSNTKLHRTPTQSAYSPSASTAPWPSLTHRTC